jgi:hypothetical protein
MKNFQRREKWLFSTTFYHTFHHNFTTLSPSENMVEIAKPLVKQPFPHTEFFLQRP